MYKKYFKRLFDILFSVILIIILSPVMVVTYILVMIFLGLPVIFKQERPGLNEKIFLIYKFKTMNSNKDINGILLPDDTRLTTFGKIIRRLSLDELPQFFNVLKGDMSFIGPRPLLNEYLVLYNEEQRKRHNVRPGITGWAQVNGRNSISWEEKFKLDEYYTENISLVLDIKIVWLTIMKILKRSDVSSDTYVTMEKFKG
ncbi:sugar transferase [Carnobacterium inhibens]|uniref:sugar transferase n=1 Tax=Carnobacterium inhibens TaxID=147709 RepID=UPI00203BCD82|nr:sugar transferase [Carnobacterium inhibens]MCM3511386.1 sugar transferase [Carnobacterium inhibens]